MYLDILNLLNQNNDNGLIIILTFVFILFIYVVSMFLKMSTIPKGPIFHRARWTLMGFVFLQLVLGIMTVLHSRGSVPVGLGVLHQAGAFLVLLNTFCYFCISSHDTYLTPNTNHIQR